MPKAILYKGGNLKVSEIQSPILGKKEISQQNLDFVIPGAVVAVVKNEIILTSYLSKKSTSVYRHIDKKSKYFIKNLKIQLENWMNEIKDLGHLSEEELVEYVTK